MNHTTFRNFATLFFLVFFSFNSNASNNPFVNDVVSTQSDESLSCVWPAGVEAYEEDLNGGALCKGDYITIEAFGYSVNGGIPADLDVSDDYTFIWNGEIEYLEERKVKIKVVAPYSILKVRYALTVEGMTCYDTAQVMLHPVYDCIHPAELSYNVTQTDPLYDEDYVSVAAIGASAAGEIPPELEVSDNYSFDWDGDIEYLDESEVRLQLDIDKDNILTITYELTVEGNTTTDTKEIQFDVMTTNVNEVPLVFESDLAIYPNPGNGLLYIDGKKFEQNKTKLELEVRSMTGQIQLKKEVIYAQKSTSLDLSELPTGIYVIRIISSDEDVENVIYYKK